MVISMRRRMPALDKIMLTPMRIKPSKKLSLQSYIPLFADCALHLLRHNACNSVVRGKDLTIDPFKSYTYGLNTAATFELRSGVNPTQ